MNNKSEETMFTLQEERAFTNALPVWQEYAAQIFHDRATDNQDAVPFYDVLERLWGTLGENKDSATGDNSRFAAWIREKHPDLAAKHPHALQFPDPIDYGEPVETLGKGEDDPRWGPVMQMQAALEICRAAGKFYARGRTIRLGD